MCTAWLTMLKNRPFLFSCSMYEIYLLSFNISDTVQQFRTNVKGISCNERVEGQTKYTKIFATFFFSFLGWRVEGTEQKQWLKDIQFFRELYIKWKKYEYIRRNSRKRTTEKGKRWHKNTHPVNPTLVAATSESEPWAALDCLSFPNLARMVSGASRLASSASVGPKVSLHRCTALVVISSMATTGPLVT